MKSIKTILLTLATAVAGTSATRADELSDLVAAISASSYKERIEMDASVSSFDKGKSRYKAKQDKDPINISLLDGILSSMKRESFRRMRRDIFGEDDDELPADYDALRKPTLGRAGFFRPVPGIITSRFGWRPKFQRIHHGIDLSLQIGDTVRAALTGTVERIAYDHDGYGHYVVVSHPDGMETIYGHLQYPVVAQGQPIFAGQPIGIGGNTGNSTGPHLHFETRLGGVAVDPLLLFDFYGDIQLYADNIPEAATKPPVYSHQTKSLKKAETYVVRYGDTPESVARQAGITVMRLCQLNMLDPSSGLTIGRMLKLK